MKFTFVRGYIYLTSACNFRCEHCAFRAEKKYIKPEEIELSLIEQFLEDFGSNFKAVNFTGEGNPILYKNLKEAIRICKQKVGNVSINCRGYINNDLLDFFKVMGVIVFYSMDWFGVKADEEMGFRGLWSQQMDTLKRMLERRLDIAIRTTIMRDNFGDVLQFIRMTENLRLKGYNVVIEMMPYLPYHDPEKTPTEEQMAQITSICLNKEFCRLLTPWWTCLFPVFRDRASRWWSSIEGGRLCEAGRAYGRIAIKQDGSLLPCPFETKTVGKYKKVYGKWQIDKLKVKQKLDEYLNDAPVDEKCKECVFFRWCGGGCRVTGNLGHGQVCPVPKLWGGQA